MSESGYSSTSHNSTATWFSWVSRSPSQESPTICLSASTVAYSSEDHQEMDFQVSQACKICMDIPSLITAQELLIQYLLLPHPGISVDNIYYLKCTRCMMLYHLECVVDYMTLEDFDNIREFNQYICHLCQ